MKNKKNVVYIFLAAIIIGIISGLSVSPVISQIVSVILGVLISTVSIFIGIENSKNAIKKISKIKTGPFFLLTLGIFIGLIGGVKARVNNYLGSNYDKDISYWSQKTGLSKEDVAVSIFKNLYPAKPNPGENIDMTKQGVLKSTVIDNCDAFCAYEGDNLLLEIKTSNNELLEILSQNLDDEELIKAVKLICKCE